MHEMMRTGRSIGAGPQVAVDGLESRRPCPACGEVLKPLPSDSRPQGRRCRICGLLFQDAADSPDDRETMVRHYRSVDPHAKVAASKAGFYRHALQHLAAAMPRDRRRLLDVGCGYGYFLEKAKASGWAPAGVEIVPEAVDSAMLRVPGAELHCGDLGYAGLPAASLDAVTLWDVLCHVESPPAEIEECYRILAPGGIIGIRVRNLTHQLWLCRWFFRIRRLCPKFAHRPLHVFHRWTFTPDALERMLAARGFSDIQIQNSPLTAGSPYRYGRRDALIGIGKSMAGAASDLLFRLSSSRWIVGPSLLVWTRKP